MKASQSALSRFLLLSFLLHSTCAFANCIDLLSKRKNFFGNPLFWLKENIAAIESKVAPTYTSNAFDIRIVSKAATKNVFSPEKLKNKAIEDVTTIIKRYEENQIKLQHFTQVIIEAHPNAIRRAQGENSAGRIVWDSDATRKIPSVESLLSCIGLPDFLGNTKLFHGTIEKKGFNQFPGILILPATSNSYHSLSNTFVLAHELAHLTENPNSHQSMIWIEARADLLAYLATDINEFIFPEGMEQYIPDANGNIRSTIITKMRSLIDPQISSIEEAAPFLDAFHFNSQIISSTLYDITQKLGKDSIFKFVIWMDRIEGERAIPHVESAFSDSYVSTANIDDFLNSAEKDIARKTIQQQIKQIGSFIRQWSQESGLSVTEQSQVLSILNQHGL